MLPDTIDLVSAEIPQLPDDYPAEFESAAAWTFHAGLVLVDFFSQQAVRVHLRKDELFRTIKLIPDTIDVSEQEPSIRQFCNYLESEDILTIAEREPEQAERVLLNAPWFSICRLDFDSMHEGMDLESEENSHIREAITLRRYFLRKFSVLEKCCFFTTQKDSLGVVFGAIDQGDVIALIRGLDRLLVLRREGDQFCLVGHGFVEGYMDGSQWPSEESKLGEISIR
jgi:hypothetical protein